MKITPEHIEKFEEFYKTAEFPDSIIVSGVEAPNPKKLFKSYLDELKRYKLDSMMAQNKFYHLYSIMKRVQGMSEKELKQLWRDRLEKWNKKEHKEYLKRNLNIKNRNI